MQIQYQMYIQQLQFTKLTHTLQTEKIQSLWFHISTLAVILNRFNKLAALIFYSSKDLSIFIVETIWTSAATRQSLIEKRSKILNDSVFVRIADL